MNNYPLLSLINSPEDLRLLNKEQLPQHQELRVICWSPLVKPVVI